MHNFQVDFTFFQNKMETRNLSAQVCRLCAYHGTKEKWTYIFSDEGNQENLADIINITLPVKVLQQL